MKISQNVNFEKYTNLKLNLDDDSGSENEDNPIPAIICDLLPVYYTYRKYLVEILKETNVNRKVYAGVLVSDQYVNERLSKCKEEKIIYDNKGNSKSYHTSRALITDKILQKKRKQLKQQKQLMKKYEAQQIDAMIYGQTGQNYKSHNAILTFQEPSFEPNHYRRRSSIQQRQVKMQATLENKSNIKKNSEMNGSPTSKKLQGSKAILWNSLKKQSKGKISIIHYEQQNKKDGQGKKEENEMRQQKQQSINSSKVIQKIKNKNMQQNITMKAQTKQSQVQEMQLNSSNQKNKSQQAKRLQNIQKQTNIDKKPKNWVNFGQKNERNLRNKQVQFGNNVQKLRLNLMQNDQELSMQQDFSGIEHNKVNINIVSVEHDDTYSQYKGRQINRHNTPDFDIFSVRGRTNNFYEIQKQKLLAQKQNADKLHDEISVVIGQDLSINQKSTRRSKHSKNVNILEEPNQNEYEGRRKSTSRLSTKSNATDFLFAVRYCLSQICQLNSYNQCYKYVLKNRQYEILKRLYSEQIGKGPIFSKLLVKKIEQLLKNQQKLQSNIITAKIFKKQAFVSFEQFGESFTPLITENEYDILSTKVVQVHPHHIDQLLSRLFSVWLEIHYFQEKLRKIIYTNSNQLNLVCEKLTSFSNRNCLDLEQIQKFLFSTSYNKINSIKVRLYFQSKLKSLKFAQFVCHFSPQK